MKKLIYGTLFLALVGIGVVGCKKENVKFDDSLDQSKIQRFDTFEDFEEKLKMLESMSDSDRRNYEKSNNYKSLRTIVYEVYEQIDMEKLTDKNELFFHVANNPDYLEIITNALGEQEYRPIYSDIRYSLIARENRMIVIGDKCVKVFDDGLIFAPMKYFNNLIKHNGKTVNSLPSNKDFEVLKSSKIEVEAKSSCGTYREREETSGTNRTRITLECYPKLISGIVPTAQADGLIRPLKRTAGVWFHAKRTINGRFAFTFAFEQNGSNFQGVQGSGQTIYVSINDIVNPTHDYSVSRPYPLPTGGFYPVNYRFSSINSFGDTPSTSSAIIVCN